MKRPVLAACLALFAAFAAPAVAQDAGKRVQDAIVAQLSTQGFTRIHVSNTFLGRVRIFATSPGTSREIIFNPRTGEILRDYWDDEDDFDDGLVSSTGAGPDDGPSARDPDDDGDDDDNGPGGGANDDDDTSDDKDDEDDDEDEEDDDDEDEEDDEEDEEDD